MPVWVWCILVFGVCPKSWYTSLFLFALTESFSGFAADEELQKLDLNTGVSEQSRQMKQTVGLIINTEVLEGEGEA